MIEMCLVLFCYRPVWEGPVYYPDTDLVYEGSDYMMEAISFESYRRHWFKDPKYDAYVYCLEEDVFNMKQFYPYMEGRE